MKSVYKNPKELATCLKDLVDLYLEDLMTEDKLKLRVVKMIEANGDAIYDEEGRMPVKLQTVLGEERKAVLDNINKER
ncbi:TIGR04540 family protein [uncultured Clostridium sp.]|uniref:TIGR04540 family protein n=1 Tax=uncultured Clostridium sp. TaxID=59620 RepID=UPI00261AC396|nr:TIGR04540 family protein [uncultured Clostridium sp.]